MMSITIDILNRYDYFHYRTGKKTLPLLAEKIFNGAVKNKMKVTIFNINYDTYKKIVFGREKLLMGEICNNEDLIMQNLSANSRNFTETDAFTFLITTAVGVPINIAIGLLTNFIYDKIKKIKKEHPSLKIIIDNKDVSKSTKKEIEELIKREKK